MSRDLRREPRALTAEEIVLLLHVARPRLAQAREHRRRRERDDLARRQMWMPALREPPRAGGAEARQQRRAPPAPRLGVERAQPAAVVKPPWHGVVLAGADQRNRPPGLRLVAHAGAGAGHAGVGACAG